MNMSMMKIERNDNNLKCIIFGCGQIGRAAYEKLKNYYEIIAWSDNNQNLWNTKLNDIIVISPEEMRIKCQNEHTDVYVAMLDSSEVIKQLLAMEIENLYLWKQGLFYSAEGLFPKEFPVSPYLKYGDENEESFHVLFISDVARIRDHKMASIVKKAGHKVFLAYLSKSPNMAYPEYAPIYDGIFPIMSLNGLKSFAMNSEFDIIHASSEPDFLVPVLNGINKPVVLDCHDLRSSTQSMTPDQMMIESLAHTDADMVIYPTTGLKNEAIKKFRIAKEKTVVMENYISETLVPEFHHEKISKIDGELHCVYEGSLVTDNTTNYKYFVEIWTKLAKMGIHIHFYSSAVNEARILEKLNNIHYEGNLNSHQLAYELSKYDVGLAIYNVNYRNKSYLEKSSPNKIFEYVNAGIPVAVSDIAEMAGFVKENHFGDVIDLTKNVVEQLKTIANIDIPDNVLEEKGYTFESMSDKLIDVYKYAMSIKGETGE